MKFNKLAIATAVCAAAIASSATAHTWNIGWKSTGGNLTFYGVSWHSGLVGGAGSVDDFVAQPNQGFIINGNNVDFDVGSATNLEDGNCNGGLVVSACSPIWNSLNVDGAIQANSTPNGSTYGKYASTTLNLAQLAAIGIGTGSNSVTFTTRSADAVWAPLAFASATVGQTIIVKPPTNPGVVPLPAALPMAAAGFGLLGFIARRKKKAA